MDKILEIVNGSPEVDEARIIRVADIPVSDWVREECRECRYHGKSWSCPPGVGSLGEARKKLSEFEKAVFVRFRTSGNRKALEEAVLGIESGFRKAGFGRVFGFFVSPCTACEECRYPGECPYPEKCRPTGEAFGIDLMETSVRTAGMPVEIVKKGEGFKPVTVFLVE